MLSKLIDHPIIFVFIFSLCKNSAGVCNLSYMRIVRTMLFKNQILALSGAINTNRYTPQKEKETLLLILHLRTK